jgi:hypothetical protein
MVKCDTEDKAFCAIYAMLALAVALAVTAGVLLSIADKPYVRCRNAFNNDLEACEAHPYCFTKHNSNGNYCSGPRSPMQKAAIVLLWVGGALFLLWFAAALILCAHDEGGMSRPSP